MQKAASSSSSALKRMQRSHYLLTNYNRRAQSLFNNNNYNINNLSLCRRTFSQEEEDGHMAWSSSPSQQRLNRANKFNNNNTNNTLSTSSSSSTLAPSSGLEDPLYKCSLTMRLDSSSTAASTSSSSQLSSTSELFLQLVEAFKSELGATSTHLASSLGHDLVIYSKGNRNEEGEEKKQEQQTKLQTTIEIIVATADEIFTDEQITVNVKSQDLQVFTRVVKMCMDKFQ